MKNVRFLIIVIFLSLCLSACNQPVEESSPEPNSDLVEFTDEVLEEKVREAIGKPSGDISILEAAGGKMNLQMHGKEFFQTSVSTFF